jgi:hypothetical protein
VAKTNRRTATSRGGRKAAKPTTAAAAADSSPPLRLEWVEAGSLTPNPANWKRHPQQQLDALRGVIRNPRIGWAGALLFNERTGRLLDGHGRLEICRSDELVPVQIGSWDDEAERAILLSLDPIGRMSEAASAELQALAANTNFAELGADRIDVEALLAHARPAEPAAAAPAAATPDRPPEPPAPAAAAATASTAADGDRPRMGKPVALTGEQRDGADEVFTRFRELHGRDGPPLSEGQILTLIFADWMAGN